MLTGMGASPYALRGVTQTLTPIEAAVQMRRTVNGALVDISASQFRKYASTIACEDQVPPALDGIWPGQQLTVDCVAELSYLTAGGSAQRTAVAGSSRAEGLYTFYRPQLTMRVIGFQTQTDEYGAVVAWQLDLEEV